MRSVTWFRWLGLLSIALGVSAPLVAQNGVEGKIATHSPKDAYEKPRVNWIVEPVSVGPRNPALYVPYRGGDFSPADGDVVVVDVTGTPSYDGSGAACNIRITIPAPADRDNFNGIGWDVTLTATNPSLPQRDGGAHHGCERQRLYPASWCRRCLPGHGYLQQRGRGQAV